MSISDRVLIGLVAATGLTRHVRYDFEMHRHAFRSLPSAVSSLPSDRLGEPTSVVFFGVAGAAPLTVIIGAISAIYAIIGSTAVPITYLVVAGILSLFTVGFVAMSRHIVNSGAWAG